MNILIISLNQSIQEALVMFLEIYIIFLSLKQDNSFFRSTIIEWNKCDQNIRNSSSFNIFRKSILKFIRPSDSLFNCHNPKGIKLLTKLRLGLGHLREHKFKHSFQDSLNHSVVVVWTLNQLRIFVFTVPRILLKHVLSWGLKKTLITIA